MLLVLIDAMVLIVMLQMIQEEQMGWGMAAVIAIVAAIATGLLALGLVAAIGLAGLLLAAIIGAAGVGVTVSLLYGVEIKRAMLIGGVFMAVHLAVSIAFQFMMR
jgi:hypothetical protein